ncbi:hypothetical protein EON63_07165 [archaeon]|nr:MAG: hypothetical protein EON63_07165 [archaeon]
MKLPLPIEPELTPGLKYFGPQWKDALHFARVSVLTKMINYLITVQTDARTNFVRRVLIVYVDIQPYDNLNSHHLFDSTIRVKSNWKFIFCFFLPNMV